MSTAGIRHVTGSDEPARNPKPIVRDVSTISRAHSHLHDKCLSLKTGMVPGDHGNFSAHTDGQGHLFSEESASCPHQSPPETRYTQRVLRRASPPPRRGSPPPRRGSPPPRPSAAACLRRHA